MSISEFTVVIEEMRLVGIVVLVRASAYLIDSGEDGHESTQHCGTDTGYVNKWTLEVTGGNY